MNDLNHAFKAMLYAFVSALAYATFSFAVIHYCSLNPHWLNWLIGVVCLLFSFAAWMAILTQLYNK